MNKEKTILRLKYLFANLVFGYFFSLGTIALLGKGDFMDFIINDPHPKSSIQILVFLIVLGIIFGANIIAYYLSRNNPKNHLSGYSKILFSGLVILFYYLVRNSKLLFLFDSSYFSFSQIVGSQEIIVLLLAFSFSFYLNNVIDLDLIKLTRKTKRIIWLLVAISSLLLFFLISYLPFSTFNAPAADVGLFNQLFYNYSRFASPYSTIRGVTHIWADHFHPTILLLVPFYWIIKSPVMIILLQVLVSVSGIIPLFLIVKKITKSYLLSLTSMLLYILFPGLQMAVNFGFYPENMAPALFLWTFWFLISNKFWKYFIFLILWIGLKESIPLHALMLGVFILFWGGSKKYEFNIYNHLKIALITIAIAIVWFVLAVKVIIPSHANDFLPWAKTSKIGYVYLNYYGDLGNSFGEIIKSIITNPLHAFYVFFHPDPKIYTIMKILFSFGGVILTPLAIVLIPMFGENFLTNRSAQYSWNFHYQAQFSAILALVSVLSIYYLYKKRKSRKIINYGSVYLLSAVIFATLLIRSPMTSLAHFKFSDLFLDKDITTALNQIPKNASVSAQNNLAPILSSRDTIYLFPRVDGAEYIVLAPKMSRFPLTDEEYQIISQGYLYGEHNYKIVSNNEKVVIFRKDQ